MVSKLSLSRPLPYSLRSSGDGQYDINPDTRNILKILRMLGDEHIPDCDKPALLCGWFFCESVPADGLELFSAFVAGGTERNNEDEPQVLDYEFDAEEIYASFRAMYGINLMTEPLHWWEFRALLGGALSGDTPLAQKIKLRTMDISKLPPEEQAEAERAQERVQLPQNIDPRERLLQELIQERLRNGEPIADLLKEMR